MKTEDIANLDWHTMLIGNTTMAFLVELAIRLFVLILAILLVTRIAGRGAVARMSTASLTGAVAVSAVFGGIVFLPSLGLIPLISIVFTLLFVQFLLSGSPKSAEVTAEVTPEKVVTLVEDGRLKFETMKKRDISNEYLFGFLRTQGIEHLGQVRRVFWETNGKFSVYTTLNAKPGLSVLPEKERDLVLETAVPDHFACADCGNIMMSESAPIVRCTRCGQLSWVEAVQELRKAEQTENTLSNQHALLRRQLY
jgi:uncharacterized membrane protein YcaP (DUF421 family)